MIAVGESTGKQAANVGQEHAYTDGIADVSLDLVLELILSLLTGKGRSTGCRYYRRSCQGTGRWVSRFRMRRDSGFSLYSCTEWLVYQ